MIRVWTFVFFAGLCHGVSLASQCTTSGRFPNDAVAGCGAYTMCIDGGNGNFIDYNLTCPPSFIFSPLENVCTNVTNYQCLDMLLPFNCTSLGDFENPHARDCGSYIACIQGLNDTVSPRLIECPTETVFSPVQKACVNMAEYKCEVEIPKPVPKPTVQVQVEDGHSIVVAVPSHNGAFDVRVMFSTLIVVLFSFIIL